METGHQSYSSTGTAPSPSTSRKKSSKKIQRKKRFRWKRAVVLLAVCFLSVTALFLLLQDNHSLESGKAYLSERANKDLDQVNSLLADLHEKQRQEALVHGPVSLYGSFSNSLVLGDSRSEGFVSTGRMSNTINLSVLSTDITYIPNFQQAVAARKPEIIYFCYGTNDIYRGIGNADNEPWSANYVSMYEDYIDGILEGSPNSRVAVNSIVRTIVDRSADSGEGWEEPYLETLNRVNKELKEMCERRGWTYIDNQPLYEEWGKSMFVSDGIHYVDEFFDPWAINMLVSAYPELKEAEWIVPTDTKPGTFSDSEPVSDSEPSLDSEPSSDYESDQDLVPES